MRGTNCAMTQPCARDINRRKRARCPVLATLVPCHYTSKEQREKSMEMFFLPDANGETSSLTTICYEHESNVYIYISLCVLHSCERSYDDYIGWIVGERKSFIIYCNFLHDFCYHFRIIIELFWNFKTFFSWRNQKGILKTSKYV